MRWRITCCALLLSVAAGSLLLGSAEEPNDEEEREPEQIVRVYNVTDLIAPIVHYPALNADGSRVFPREGLRPYSRGCYSVIPVVGENGGGLSPNGGLLREPPSNQFSSRPFSYLGQFGGGSGVSYEESDAERYNNAIQRKMSDLKDCLEYLIYEDPRLGYSNNHFRIQNLDTEMIVSANDPTQRKVEEFLEALRTKSAKMHNVTARVYWLWLDDKQLAELLGGSPEEMLLEKGPSPTVDRGLLNKHLAALANADKGLAGYRAALTALHGQTVHALAGAPQQAMQAASTTETTTNQQNIKTEKTTAGSLLVSPFRGAIVELTPAVNANGTHVTLDLHSRVAVGEYTVVEPAGQRNEPFGPGVALRRLERPTYAHRLSTTLRVPVGQPVLVGGMSFEATPKAGDKSLYVFVETFVQKANE